MSKRISVRIVNPNPLFRKWISEWENRVTAEGKEKPASALRRALASLEKYPLKLETGRDCGILEGFGTNICDFLDKKLEKYNRKQPPVVVTNTEANIPPVSAADSPFPSPPPKKTAPKKGGRPKKSLSQEILTDPVAGPSNKQVKKTIRKTKSEQNLPKGQDGNEKAGTKRKATTTTVDEEQEEGVVVVAAEDFIMAPGTFEIILLVDSMETVGAKKRHMDTTILELQKNQVPHEVRRLNIGDFTWIARDARGRELVLPYIVERKRLDDLAGSIKSGRYQEQKFRLKNSGIPNVTYLIEYLDVKNYGLPIQTLYKAVVNAEVHQCCQVKFSDGPKETMLYLSVQTTLLAELFATKTLCSCPKENLAVPKGGIITADTISLMQFGVFNKAASKYGAINIKDFFVRQLIQLHQMSVEKAMAITDVYPTPRALLTAYADPKLVNDSARQALLAKIPYGPNNRTIGASLSKIIFDLYHSESPS